MHNKVGGFPPTLFCGKEVIAMYDIIIIGAGPAGLTAAIYARRANKSVLLLEKGAFGEHMVIDMCGDGPITLVLDSNVLLNK